MSESFLGITLTTCKTEHNMKKYAIILVLLLSFATIAKGQLRMVTNEYPNYQGVVEVNGQTADNIYSDLHVWYLNQFKAMGKSLQLEDKDRQRLVIKGSFPFEIKKSIIQKSVGKCDVLITLDTKDERFRFLIEVTDVYIDGNKSIAKELIEKPNKKTSKLVLDEITEIKNKLISEITIVEKKSSTDW